MQQFPRFNDGQIKGQISLWCRIKPMKHDSADVTGWHEEANRSQALPQIKATIDPLHGRYFDFQMSQFQDSIPRHQMKRTPALTRQNVCREKGLSVGSEAEKWNNSLCTKSLDICSLRREGSFNCFYCFTINHVHFMLRMTVFQTVSSCFLECLLALRAAICFRFGIKKSICRKSLQWCNSSQCFYYCHQSCMEIHLQVQIDLKSIKCISHSTVR